MHHVPIATWVSMVYFPEVFVHFSSREHYFVSMFDIVPEKYSKENDDLYHLVVHCPCPFFIEHVRFLFNQTLQMSRKKQACSIEQHENVMDMYFLEVFIAHDLKRQTHTHNNRERESEEKRRRIICHVNELQTAFD